MVRDVHVQVVSFHDLQLARRAQKPCRRVRHSSMHQQANIVRCDREIIQQNRATPTRLGRNTSLCINVHTHGEHPPPGQGSRAHFCQTRTCTADGPRKMNERQRLGVCQCRLHLLCLLVLRTLGSSIRIIFEPEKYQ